MNAFFAKILEMSLYGSIAILVVLLFRLIFHRLPKRVLIVFWMVVAVRLVLPINFASPTSLLNASRLFESGAKETSVEQVDKTSSEVSSEEPDRISDPEGQSAISPKADDAEGDTRRTTDLKAAPAEDVSRLNKDQALAIHIVADVWLLVIVALSVLFIVRYLIFYSNARWKSRAYDGSYFTTNIKSPFVIGFIRPKIFIPEKFDEDEKEYILNHEWTHIKNKDGVIKLIGFAILCIHWFNPLVWLAFVILCADIEMRVDEETTEAFDTDMVKEYCISLVKHAYADAGGSFMQNTAFSGLGFGGMETKLRIKNLLKTREVKKFMPILAIIVTFSVVFFASSRSLGSPIEDYFDTLGRSPEKEVEETEEAETESTEMPTFSSETEAPSESTGYEQAGFVKAYTDILNKLDPNKPTIKCALLHIDNDQTPELVITDSWDCRYNGFKLTIYTYVDDDVACVLDQVDADDAYYHFYCYEPGSGAVCMYEETDNGDPSVDPYVVEENTILSILSGMPSRKTNYVNDTPDWVIMGHEDVKATIERLTTWNIPEDSLYEKHPKYAPKDPSTQTSTAEPTTTEAPTVSTMETAEPTEPTETTSMDYSKYLGRYVINDGYYELLIPSIDMEKQEITFSWFIYRTGLLDTVIMPFAERRCYFYYHGTYDENFDGIIDDSEYYYRMGTLEFHDDGIRLCIQDCEPSEIIPDLDVSESFSGNYYVKEGIHWFPFTSKQAWE